MDPEFLVQVKKLVIVIVVFQLAIFLGILLYKLWKRVREIKLQSHLLKRVAVQFSGQFQSGGKLGYPKTLLPYKNNEMVVYYRPRSRYKKASTVIECGVGGGKEFEFCIYPRSLLADVAKLVGMQDVEIGQHVFDQKFIIKTNKPLVIKEYLHQDLCRHVLGLPMPHISIKLQKGRFVFSVQHMLKEDQEYFQMVEVARQLVDELAERT